MNSSHRLELTLKFLYYFHVSFGYQFILSNYCNTVVLYIMGGFMFLVVCAAKIMFFFMFGQWTECCWKVVRVVAEGQLQRIAISLIAEQPKGGI